MGAKGSGVPCAYPGAKLAKGWVEASPQELAKYLAGRKLLGLIDQSSTQLSRRKLLEWTRVFARVVMIDATLEEVRGYIILLEEDLGL